MSERFVQYVEVRVPHDSLLPWRTFEAGMDAIRSVFGPDTSFRSPNAGTEDGNEWERRTARELEEVVTAHGVTPRSIDSSFQPVGKPGEGGLLIVWIRSGTHRLDHELSVQLNSESRIQIEQYAKALPTALEESFARFGIPMRVELGELKHHSTDRGEPAPSAPESPSYVAPEAPTHAAGDAAFSKMKEPNWLARTWRDHTVAFLLGIVGTVVGGTVLVIVLGALGLSGIAP